ncbi:LysR family transcriptional regulator [Salipiger thiooxidans]|uniref:LysR family transcriptional regulator n=1 Tax=Salipiger thiooxidans TaxID=282683 RepID=UPI001CD37ED3|nr:LysR substrate-binding domain-containing protein [Salipiger thiooxidans]MCA0851447.1 LysR family transcriptional regulator [Salipiger thiooxidans]
MRPLNLDELRTFLAIQETGTFRAAAARVNLSASAVSLQISNLEAVLGCRLFHRNARGVALTEEGDRLLPKARELLRLSQAALSAFDGGSIKGALHLSAPHDLGVSLVPGLLGRLREAYPDLRVDVRLAATDQVIESFTAGRSAVALFNDVGPATLTVEGLTEEPLVWAEARGGVASEQQPLPLAVAEVGCAWRDAALQALAQSGISYRVAYASDTSMGQVAALRADLAVAVLPKSMLGHDLQEVPAGRGLPALPRTHIRVAHDGGTLAEAVVGTLRKMTTV